MKFEEMTLSPEIMSGLNDIHYSELTVLQEQVIPAILSGNDALIKAPTGGDKNASFIVPALEMINGKEDKEVTSVLVLTPNPKEAKEIDELVWAMGYHAQIECASIDMDGDEEEQSKALQSGVEVVVANPGPLMDIMQNKRFIFRNIDLLVIDSADKMLSLNLLSKIENIKKRVITDPQVLIYTSELTDEVKELAKDILGNPAVIGFENVGPEAVSEPPKLDSKLTQGYIYVPNRMKISTLMAHIEDTPTDTCVIFTASKRGTDRLYRIFRKHNLKVTSLHGKLSDEKRAQRFANFTNGDVQYLLVADIPASQLDLERVTQVINYDVPNDPDEYRYRASLVGHGKASRIVSLVSKQDRSDINKLENALGQAPKEIQLPKKIQQKLTQRKKKKRSGKKSSKKKPKRGRSKKASRNGRGKKKRGDNEMHLPRPSYDKLSGGRKGDTKQDEKSTVIGLIKKLFS
ncbi:MAG: DEAD/DEAH box helicase [Balneolaceae bacterium]